MSISYPGVYVQETANGVRAIDGVTTHGQVSYPGVYLEEIASGVSSLEGVPTSTAGLTDAPRESAPAWTDRNGSDPGVTLLQLFAFLGDSLLYRAGHVPERSSGSLVQAAPPHGDGERSTRIHKP